MSGWNTERETLLKTYWTQGLSASEIAKKIGGVTRNAVIGKAVRMNLPARAERGVRRGAPRSTKYKTGRPHGEPSAPRVIRAATIKPDNHKPKGATPGPSNIPFITRTDSHCPMFIEGEEGPDGMICGRAKALEQNWCAGCARLVFAPTPAKRAA